MTLPRKRGPYEGSERQGTRERPRDKKRRGKGDGRTYKDGEKERERSKHEYNYLGSFFFYLKCSKDRKNKLSVLKRFTPS